MQPDKPIGLRSLISDDRSSKTSRLRRMFLEIDGLKSEGVTDKMLVEALAKAGVKFTSRSSFATTLARVRKEIRDGKFNPGLSAAARGSDGYIYQAASSTPVETPTSLQIIPPAAEPTGINEADIYTPRLSKKELREKKASRISLDSPNTNPLLFAVLKEQSK